MPDIRAVLILLWLLSPAILLSISFRGQKTRWIWLIACLTAFNWILFVVELVRSQTQDGMIFETSVLTHLFLLLACVVAILGVRKWPLLMANVALVSLWIGVAYAQAHWLTKSAHCTVRVDGQQENATVYMGSPTDSEAEAVALVDIPGTGDYFLSFGTEKVKPATNREFIHLPGGIWVFKSMRELRFVSPLPFMAADQWRIAAPDGRVIEVQW